MGLKRLKDKQAKRKEIRAEQEKKLAQQKKEEEERVRKEEAERKAKEAEEKKKRLEEAEQKRQAMMEAQKEGGGKRGHRHLSLMLAEKCPRPRNNWRRRRKSPWAFVLNLLTLRKWTQIN